MYNIFEQCILDFSYESNPGDYWYDCAIIEASHILKLFTDGDWEYLYDQINQKPIFWQKRVIEILDGTLSQVNELKIIIKVINTENEDLFITCIDALRSLDLSKLNLSLKNNLLLRLDKIKGKKQSLISNIINELELKLR